MGSTGFFWPKVGADQCRVPLPQAEREKMLKQREEQQLEVGRNTGCKNPYGRVSGASENLHGGCSSCWTDMMGKGRELQALEWSS